MENEPVKQSETVESSGRLSWLITTLKVIGWSIASIVAIVLIICSLIVWILTPSQLTPLVEKHASDYLNAEVTAARVELTFWHTFPKMTVDIDSLNIISHSLVGLPDSISAILPANADSLLSLGHLHAGLNVASLSVGRISLYDVVVDRLKTNLLQVDDSWANFNIMPESDEVADDNSGNTIPPISINRFAITDAGPIRYRSIPDSLDVEINLYNIDFIGKDAPNYRLIINADGRAPALEKLNRCKLPISIDGGISWSDKHPKTLDLTDFTVVIDSIETKLSTSVDFSDSITVNSLQFNVDRVNLSYLLSLLPADLFKGKKVETNMSVTFSGKLTEPYNVADTTVLPSFDAMIKIPDCYLHFDRLRLHKLELQSNIKFNGRDVDASTVDIERMIVKGDVIGFDFKGTVSTLISDPMIDAKLRATVNFGRLPEFLYSDFARVISGNLEADISVVMKRSDLSADRFHRIKLTGNVDLNDFTFVSNDSVNRIYVLNTCFQFGTNKRFVNDAYGVSIDSLLTASIKADSVNVSSGPIGIVINDLKAGVGTKVAGNMTDTTVIRPFGGVISFGRLKLDDTTDSSLIRLSGVLCRASLTRYEGNVHVPLLRFNFDADRLLATDRKSFVSLAKSHFDVNAHIRKLRRLSPDSVAMLRRRNLHINRPVEDANLDLEVDSGMKALLRQWDVSGSITAMRGGFITPSLPVRNRLRNVDLHFSIDSVSLHNL
ncbi:MAG: hypothetical protein NC311_16190, partial [Muribaculaceae bacterium]|nr:hypothetical protein [Muribaculaceae bacterium]